METFDACVFVFTGLTTGMAIGLAIRNKKTKNLQDELDYLENRYKSLVDDYTECVIENHNVQCVIENHRLQFEKYLKPITPVKKEVVVKKKVGRPKGSTNKPKQDGKPTTRKYTRKSSK
jgi:hypothetical protein